MRLGIDGQGNDAFWYLELLRIHEAGQHNAFFINSAQIGPADAAPKAPAAGYRQSPPRPRTIGSSYIHEQPSWDVRSSPPREL